MLTLILTLMFGIIFAFFATQNVASTTLFIGPYVLSNIPLYLVILGSMLLGIIISGIITGINSLFTFVSMKGKDVKIHRSEKEVEHMHEKLRLLELENAKLKGLPIKEKVEVHEHEIEERRPTFFSRLRQSFP